MTPHEKREAHTTLRELEFLQGVVKNTNTPRPRTPPQIKMVIQSYISTIDKRQWDAGVDVGVIRTYATRLL